MSESTQLITQAAGIAILLAHAGLLVLLVHIVSPISLLEWPITFLKKHGLLLGALVAFGAIVSSLYYSEIVGWEPCKLCWLQRIFIYPSAVILFVAWLRDDRDVWRYVVPLSGFGAFFSLWHYLLQKTGSAAFSCGADSTAECAVVYFNEFGYITFPMMGLTICVLVAVCAWFARGEKTVHTPQ